MERATSQGRSNEGAARGPSALRYPYLRDACKDFLVDALELLKRRPVPSREAAREEMEGIIYGWTVAYRQRLMALPSAAHAASAVEKSQLDIGKVTDKDGKELASEEYAPGHVFDIVLAPLVAEYVAANRGRASYNARLYGTLYAHLEEAYSVGPLFRFVAALENFEAERPRVRLETDLWIERLTRADMQYLTLYFPQVGQVFTEFGAPRPQWGIVTVHRSHRFAPFSGHMAKFRTLLLALRLTRPEPVGYRFVVDYPARHALRAAALGGASSSMRPALFQGPKYVLTRTDENRARSIFRDLSDGAVLSEYPVAFSRFDDAYWRAKPEDALIDVWIALESLFMPDADPREATFRLALRIAYFLGRTSQERLDIDKDIRDSYKLRSDVVHGRSDNQPNLKALANKTAGYLRQALQAVVNQGAKLDVNKIDRAVRAGKNPRKIE